jgi:hypothetical protein
MPDFFSVVNLSVLLYLFYALMFFYFIFSFFNIYHLLRFGPWSLINFSMIFVFLLLSFWLFIFSLQTLWSFDWQSPLFAVELLEPLSGILKIF